MDPFDQIAEETIERFGLFEKWRAKRQHKKAMKAMAKGDTEKAHEHRARSQELQDRYADKRRGYGEVPRRHMTRSEHEAMMDERDGRRRRRPRRRRSS
jgi:hypothetical protein